MVCQNATPWCCFCGFVDGYLRKQTPVANVLAHGGGELFASMAVYFGAGCGKVAPRGAVFSVLWANFQGVGKSARVGCFGKLQSKSHPVVAKTHLLDCSCGAKWWQRRNWLPLQKHAHGVGVQSVSDVGCGVSVGGRGSVFSSAVQVLHWLCWAVCSASWASCSAVRCACSTLGV